MRHLLYAVLVGVVIVSAAEYAAVQAQNPPAAEAVFEARSTSREGLGQGGSDPGKPESGRPQVIIFGNNQWPTLNSQRATISEAQSFYLFFGPLSQMTPGTNLFMNAPMNSINTHPTTTQAKTGEDKLGKPVEAQQMQIQIRLVNSPAEDVQKAPPVGRTLENQFLEKTARPLAEGVKNAPLMGLTLGELQTPRIQQPTATQAPEILQLTAAQGKADDEKLRKQLEAQQKQIQTLEKMVKLLGDEVKKAPPVGPAVEKLQTQAAILEARQQQAAQRDQDLANAVDDLRETADAERRNLRDLLPPTLKELFDPQRTNESPIGCWGTLSANFTKFGSSNSQFTYDLLPHFYMLLNEHFMFEVNPDLTGTTIDMFSCQIDWCVTDNLCLEFGRIYTPFGFFNDRLHTSWVYKTPDRPLMFSQVVPEQWNINGAVARGADYPTALPIKLEYSAFVCNGFSLAAANPTAHDFADLAPMKDTATRVNNQKAFGGRLGVHLPELGWTIGGSGFCNGAYDAASKFDLNIWDIDVSYHKGNWDFRFEYANTAQQAPVHSIHRRGFYAQLAYRPFDLPNGFLQKMEGVLRYDQVRFTGIDLAQTGVVFASREAIPVDRNRYSIGLNHYLYESLILKFFFEINQEMNFRSLKDNGFLFQVAWGF